MKLTIEIHDGWLGRPEEPAEDPDHARGSGMPADGRRRPTAGPRPPRGPGGAIRPGRPAPGPQRKRSVPGERRPQPGERRHGRRGGGSPTDGRQLLGWAAKQVPDAKGRVISVGKKRGYPSRILDWTPQQVAAAYRTARGVAVIHTGGGNLLAIPSPMPRALEARGGLRHSELADADGGRSGCPGRLRRGRQHPSERPVGICASWRCCACGARIRLDRATGAVRLDTSRAVRAMVK